MPVKASKNLVGLPDFKNLGVILRIVVMTEAVNMLMALLTTENWRQMLFALVARGGVVEPILLLVLLILIVVNERLGKLPYPLGCGLVIGVSCLTALVWSFFYPDGLLDVWNISWRTGIASGVMAALVLFYFNWRHRVYSPALAESRLMALQSRIRPHFLFNSLNTVLGVIRVEPKLAERVLENLAELYRALLSESGSLVRLGREIELARAYADIEIIRLGARLSVNWQCQSAPLDALVPPLILQPLLENAVYHGIEPSESGGAVDVTIFLKGDQLNLVVRNPCLVQERREGNRMALSNIRERLSLHFDAEAEMSAYEAGGEFVVQIRMPYKHG